MQFDATVPTVADRVAQIVVKQYLELGLDRVFDPNSYGYRPGKSAHQAIEQTHKRCWIMTGRWIPTSNAFSTRSIMSFW
ncbi:hypothetical protein KIP88_42515 [Bradyrhizobium sp. SRL28]|uniref:hypothetical protein n=1 Tax=Bradyrhizobium sp. SRL28 TaxID=2836178 RepID=UPI001BDE59AC|nr:hypothetical protein [Bradyrhizobium sp. SRL28]MBT1517052.1 hypothetical protein [Bradyrhizobium sp. SRL28]